MMEERERETERERDREIERVNDVIFVRSICFPFLFNFVPNWGDNVLVGSGRKLLGPTKITSFFRS